MNIPGPCGPDGDEDFGQLVTLNRPETISDVLSIEGSLSGSSLQPDSPKPNQAVPRRRSVNFGDSQGCLEVVQTFRPQRPVQEITTGGHLQATSDADYDASQTKPGILRIELLRLEVPTTKKSAITCYVTFQVGRHVRKSAKVKTPVADSKATCIFEEAFEMDVEDSKVQSLEVRLLVRQLLGTKQKLAPAVLIPLNPLTYWKKTQELPITAQGSQAIITLQFLPAGQGSGPLGYARKPGSFVERAIMRRRNSTPIAHEGSESDFSDDSELDVNSPCRLPEDGPGFLHPLHSPHSIPHTPQSPGRLAPPSPFMKTMPG